MKEASCINMTERVVKPGLKKSMGAKTVRRFLVEVEPGVFGRLTTNLLRFTKERGFLSLCVEVADT